MPNHPADIELLKLLCGSDLFSREKALRLIEGMIWNPCKSMCNGDEQRAEVLMQDTIARAFHKSSTYNGEGKLRAWLLAIARKLVIDYAQEEAKRRSREVAFDPALIGGSNHGLARGPRARVTSESSDPATQVIAAEEEQELRKMLAQMTEDQARVLQLLERGASYLNISSRENMKIRTVGSRISRARSSFMELLEMRAKAADR